MSAPPELPYTNGLWNGIVTFQCKYCSWDTTDGEDRFFEHLIKAHPFRDPDPPPMRISPVLDRFGRPMLVPDTIQEG